MCEQCRGEPLPQAEYRVCPCGCESNAATDADQAALTRELETRRAPRDALRWLNAHVEVIHVEADR